MCQTMRTGQALWGPGRTTDHSQQVLTQACWGWWVQARLLQCSFKRWVSPPWNHLWSWYHMIHVGKYVICALMSLMYESVTVWSHKWLISDCRFMIWQTSWYDDSDIMTFPIWYPSQTWMIYDIIDSELLSNDIISNIMWCHCRYFVH